MNALRISRPSADADGDVLEVRRLARDAAGGGVGLLERRVDTTVGTDQRRERVGVGAAQLLHLAIAQQVFDDRVLVGHLLERVGVGGRAGLRLLHRDEAELLEENRAELRRGVDVELLPRVRVDPMDEHLALLREVGRQGVEELAVDADAGRLHLRQHPHERELEALVEIGELASLDGRRERARETQHHRGPATGLLGLDVAVEIERAGLGVRRTHLERQVAERKIVEHVLPGGGIEEVRHHRGVVLQRARVDIETVHQLLRSVGDQRRPTCRQQHDERIPHRRVAQQLGVDVRGAIAVREPDGAQRAR